jgi:molybdopterin synthase catalytic subunit
MKLRIRYFARLREIAGRSDQTITLEAASATVADVFDAIATEHGELADLRAHVRPAVQREFADWQTPVCDGDEIAFIPPVSGGADAMTSADGRIRITRQPVNATTVTDLVRRPAAGAVVTFEGVVRDHTGDRDVDHLEYDAYVEMAFDKLASVAGEASERWANAVVAVHHRWGRLEIGDVAVAIAVSCPHRADAFDACRWVIDTLKEVVPIWKKEVSPDGSEWVGMGP